jgi:purine-binding chemotaxis protein CheW
VRRLQPDRPPTDDLGVEGQLVETAPVDAYEARAGAILDDDVQAGGIVLRLGTSRYTVAMTDVAEVISLPTITRIPGSPPFLRGVANWRGRMLPVLDLRPLLGTPTIPLATSARLVVVQDGAVTAGIVAEAVPGVYDAALTDAEPPPATLSLEAARLVSGQVSDGLGPIAVLDVVAVLGLRERVDRRRHGG